MDRFSNKDIRRIQGAVNHAEAVDGQFRTLPSGRRPSPRRSGFWAKLTAEGTGADAGKYSWTKQHPDPENIGETKDYDDMTGTLNAYEIHGQEAIPENTIVWLVCIGFAEGEPYYVFQGRKPNELFIVDVTQNGGSAGNLSTKCSFTYDVYDIDTAEKINDSTLSPEWEIRTDVGEFKAATKGEAYYDTEGTLKLWRVDEVPEDGTCP